MKPEQVKIILLTFSQVASNKDRVGQMFYERLFAIAPETRPMFKGDMAEQSQKLMDTLALAIGSLRDMPSLVATLESLALSHVDYGVRDEHYGTVGEALIWTLEKGLGEAFTRDAREAWTALYGEITQTMRRAAANRPSHEAAVG
jgi:hemoglobin-like flavoprotein